MQRVCCLRSYGREDIGFQSYLPEAERTAFDGGFATDYAILSA